MKLNPLFEAILESLKNLNYNTAGNSSIFDAALPNIQVAVNGTTVEITSLNELKVPGFIKRTTTVETLADDISKLAKNGLFEDEDIVLTLTTTLGQAEQKAARNFNTSQVFQEHHMLEDALVAALCLAAAEREKKRCFVVVAGRDEVGFGYEVHTVTIGEEHGGYLYFIAFPAGREATDEPDVEIICNWTKEIEPHIHKAALHRSVNGMHWDDDLNIKKVSQTKRLRWIKELKSSQKHYQSSPLFMKMCKDEFKLCSDILHILSRHPCDNKIAAAATAELL